jgi:hydroxymethylbilane synthase
VLPREDPRDAVVLPARGPDDPLDVRPESIEDLVAKLGEKPVVGTSSVRRIAQLARLFPNARFEPIRGNLDTRLRKLDTGQYDAIVLAVAGLRRLGMEHRISMALPPSACIPAPGQGIVAIEVRRDNHAVHDLVAALSDRAAAAALDAERSLVAALGAGCQMPVGALAAWIGEPGTTGAQLELTACVVTLDGSRAVRGVDRGPAADGAALGRRVAARLLEEGAGEILEAARR